MTHTCWCRHCPAGGFWAANVRPGGHTHGSLTTTPEPTISTSPAVQGESLRSLALAAGTPKSISDVAASVRSAPPRRAAENLDVCSRCMAVAPLLDEDDA